MSDQPETAGMGTVENEPKSGHLIWYGKTSLLNY